MAPNKNDVTLNNGVKLTLKEVELMFAVFKNSSESLKKSVDWTAVSQATGHGYAKSVRDRFSHVAKRFGWCKPDISTRRAARATKK
ncbi:hypothetical protein F5Y05DRAFT_411897 [Hypoxylon sp. FL0543]|nr:hypothetical protein F5Y05DRAFT_411897 [Hypoxylon sp. FL0543]